MSNVTVNMNLERSVYNMNRPVVSRQCLICEKAENENADIINAGIAWVCPECKAKLRKIMEEQT